MRVSPLSPRASPGKAASRNSRSQGAGGEARGLTPPPSQEQPGGCLPELGLGVDIFSKLLRRSRTRRCRGPSGESEHQLLPAVGPAQAPRARLTPVLTLTVPSRGAQASTKGVHPLSSPEQQHKLKPTAITERRAFGFFTFLSQSLYTLIHVYTYTLSGPDYHGL